jgi:hypothetical protein
MFECCGRARNRIADERGDYRSANYTSGAAMADAGTKCAGAHGPRAGGARRVIPAVIGHRRCHEKSGRQAGSGAKCREWLVSTLVSYGYQRAQLEAMTPVQKARNCRSEQQHRWV